MDLLSSQTGQNRTEHHTDSYHGEEMIIRRGQTFQIEMELNRPFSADTDKLYMDLRTGMEEMDSASVCLHHSLSFIHTEIRYKHIILGCTKLPNAEQIYSGCPKPPIRCRQAHRSEVVECTFKQCNRGSVD